MEAGERLARDFWHAQLQPRVTANWSAPAPSDRTRRSAPGFGVDMSDAVVAARQRFHRALDAPWGPSLPASSSTCAAATSASPPPSRRAAGRPRSAKAVLDVALTALARHYGLIAPGAPVGTSRPRHWGDADYRPTLEKWR